MTLDEIIEIVKEEDFDVTFTGGDPLYMPDKIATLAKAIKDEGYNIWLYTGFTIEEISQSPHLSMPLPYLDAIVEGPYIEAERDPDLIFRGSRNQRIISNEEFLNGELRMGKGEGGMKILR